MSSLARQRFFQKQVHMSEWKNSMSGQNEEQARWFLENVLGYTADTDYVRQHPIGERFVIDFAFVNEQVAVEIDGANHLGKKQRKIDAKRDKYLTENNWVSVRINDVDFKNKNKMRFYKALIHDIVDERRKQWEIGSLYAVDIPNYKDEDYE